MEGSQPNAQMIEYTVEYQLQMKKKRKNNVSSCVVEARRQQQYTSNQTVKKVVPNKKRLSPLTKDGISRLLKKCLLSQERLKF